MFVAEGKRAAGASNLFCAPRDEKKPLVLSHGAIATKEEAK